MKTFVVGDIHGRLEIVQEALESEHRIIFLGDFLDSYDRNSDEQVQALELVLDAIEENPDKVSSVIGNHERSYLSADERCSGWKQETQSCVNHLKRDIQKLFKPYLISEGFLISHAGVSQALLEVMSSSLDDYLEAGEFLQVGYTRGGDAPVGGLYWCDWFQEFYPVIGTPQIVGHSGYRPSYCKEKGILKKGNSFNVDCFQHKKEFLKIENGKGEIVESLN